MRLSELPLLSSVLSYGADDQTFDGLLLSGLLLIALVAVVGRTAWTSTIAAAYLLVFVGYIVYLGLE